MANHNGATGVKVSITKSRAGHYTVTIWNGNTRAYIEDKIGNLETARRVAAEQKAKIAMPTDEQYLAAIGPCGK